MHDQLRGDHDHEGGGGGTRRAPGKRTLTAQLPAARRREDAASDVADAGAHDEAEDERDEAAHDAVGFDDEPDDDPFAMHLLGASAGPTASAASVQRKPDRHNPHVTSNAQTESSVRPGVDFAERNPDTFELVRNARRFTFDERGRRYRRDTLPARRRNGEPTTVAVNAAPPRVLNGVTYILVHAGAKGAAWMDKRALGAQARRVTAEAKRLVDHEWHRDISDEDLAKARRDRRAFRPTYDRSRTFAPFDHIRPDKPAGDDRIDHYLGKHGVYNVCLNLPSSDAPPVAVDVVLPGHTFFVLRHAEVKTYRALGQPRDHGTMTWVFGFLGYVHGGRMEPNPRRCGWVPLVVVQ